MAGEIIKDNFLKDFDSFREYCDKVDYSGEMNPVDGVFYHGVSLDIPQTVKKEIIEEIESTIDQKIVVNSLFLRLSTKEMPSPHQAHTDSSMGDFSLMLYMSRLEDCEGGTSLVLHKKTGLCSDPINKKQLSTWERDTKNSDAWQVTAICQMMPNRAFIFPSNLMHRAEPVGGFGDNAKNGRLVLTVFFNYD